MQRGGSSFLPTGPAFSLFRPLWSREVPQKATQAWLLCRQRAFGVGREIIRHEMKRREKAPFIVYRSAADNLVVYLDFKKNKNECSTFVRKVKGDREAFKRELEAICQAPVIDHGDKFEIRGRHKNIIKQYLEGCGF
uniref:Large ribosomal subunit protein mL49 n=1 Tax=Chromera velia CCMP2878 TaxID=1169474 RepID=A0A0G4FTB5_9ALVE|mmetsp:Transcript_38077/g.74811  ORF Transcript_38077/g.74811 Transcript_38077/m.74811 type:complete len:137 (-) Transcript_38077:199-609(-)|eukprot:Cvel_3725.t1-p1 / transcript=Cvel_3725.t1 / gene=Cvel_3725 / organism=Chromera_velia_CCMP2878 / gene_product=hypothetical protein / transcript_product=hypothetical protein / location=Cvel_scaffold155:14538-16118(-) / protein_length=136 / sequence_SO=supercontig / SO=protein_coding / is_pseudo=false